MNPSSPSHQPLPPEPPLTAISYAIAYEILPYYAFRDREKLLGMFRDTPATTGPFFYLMACQAAQSQSVPEIGRQFQARHGELDDAREFYLLEYPEPPPFDLTGVDMERLPPGAMPVLAPHFSALLVHRDTAAAQYFILGQAPLGGTTLRSITADGRNANLGRGPDPSVEAFLETIRSRG